MNAFWRIAYRLLFSRLSLAELIRASATSIEERQNEMIKVSLAATLTSHQVTRSEFAILRQYQDSGLRNNGQSKRSNPIGTL